MSNSLYLEALDLIMLDHLSNNGGNLFINAASQIQNVQYLLDKLRSIT